MTTEKVLTLGTAGIEEKEISTGGTSADIGQISIWPDRTSIPVGKLPLDGQTVLRTDAPELTAMILASQLPVVSDATWLSDIFSRGSFTAGDGSTTIRLPDMNGQSVGSAGAVFVRGDGALSSGTPGIIQASAMEDHHHPLLSGSSSASSLTATTNGISGQTGVGAAGDVVANTRYDDIASDGNSHVGNASLLPDNNTAAETRALNNTIVWVVKATGSGTGDQLSNPDLNTFITDYSALPLADNKLYVFKNKELIEFPGGVGGFPITQANLFDWYFNKQAPAVAVNGWAPVAETWPNLGGFVSLPVRLIGSPGTAVVPLIYEGNSIATGTGTAAGWQPYTSALTYAAITTGSTATGKAVAEAYVNKLWDPVAGALMLKGAIENMRTELWFTVPVQSSSAQRYLLLAGMRLGTGINLQIAYSDNLNSGNLVIRYHNEAGTLTDFNTSIPVAANSTHAIRILLFWDSGTSKYYAEVYHGVLFTSLTLVTTLTDIRLSAVQATEFEYAAVGFDLTKSVGTTAVLIRLLNAAIGYTLKT